MIQFDSGAGKFTFVAQGLEGDTPWIMVRESEKSEPWAHCGSFYFGFGPPPGTTSEEAREMARFLNLHVSSFACACD